MAIPSVKLGTQGLEVSKLGFGCMGLTGVYNLPLSDEAGISIIKHAFDNGITFFDTSDAYGPHTCEILLGKALKLLPREKVQVATKFGIVSYDANHVEVSGKPEFVRASCEASLKRLGTEYIDLYYQHRVDKNTPIEETVGELKKLVEEGKVKYVGLSEASPDTIRRAHAVHPISALQMEWSLWTREIEPEIVPLCRELGIGIVPYSPLGRGFFGGKGVLEDLSPNTFLHFHPRFMGENLEKNKPVFMQLENLSKKHQCTTAQLALAWVLHQGEDVVPIPGTTKIKNLDDNIGALKLNLSKQDLEEITELVKENEVSGYRTFFSLEHATWRNSLIALEASENRISAKLPNHTAMAEPTSDEAKSTPRLATMLLNDQDFPPLAPIKLIQKCPQITEQIHKHPWAQVVALSLSDNIPNTKKISTQAKPKRYSMQNPFERERNLEIEEQGKADYPNFDLNQTISQIYIGINLLPNQTSAEKFVNTSYGEKNGGREDRVTTLCDHCKIKNHARSDCWILHPHLRPSRNKGRGDRAVHSKKEAKKPKGEKARCASNLPESGESGNNHRTFLSAISQNEEPKNFEEAINQPVWCKAMKEELQALEKNNTWTIVPLPKNKKPVRCKWVYKIKYNSDGTIERYKARLVAKGYTQTYGIDYKEPLHPLQK
ncbi:hypothetical protein LUZ61_009314 [Rhynchospora tenuis]|uniref:Uncharacterized protein n=1 Tax=Rhynchospora tenuis TaxID=198213 RepID=A0AAD6EYB1_9POAL|nr:hypothetical protein LUZ61_009314 [Rhynchospora tenuis]